ncbi:MAG: HEPN domain-containing protein [Planctomycetes bacterium]|nr:HEPN domain-containing protein [Planctomycetota bacterium]
MTNHRMARGYLNQARAWLDGLPPLLARGAWATVVRQAEECVELYLKGALRLVGVEPTHTHDVSGVLEAHAGRFPAWFAAEVSRLAAFSRDLARDRGPAFYGDEAAGVPPEDLFDEADARRAFEAAEVTARLCERLPGGAR